MHRNTTIIIGLLAVLAALVVGIRVGSKLNGKDQLAQTLASPSALSIPANSPQVAGQATLKSYAHQNCGVSFDYSSDFILNEASDSATLKNTKTQEEINLICGVDFPKPPLPEDKIDEATIAGQLATIYHDARAEDGKPIDVVVFNHPTNQLEIALFGFGQAFTHLLSTLSILK